MFSKPLSTKIQENNKIYFFDKVLARTLIPFIPESVKPNHITMFRFLTTPLVAYLLWRESYLIGLISFILVAFTDALDGALARIRNQVTDWGKVYDPLADKILIGLVVYIIVLRYIDIYAALIIIGLEMLIIATAFVRKRRGEVVQANIWGKIKMVLQVLGVVVLLLAIAFDVESFLPFSAGVFYLAIAFGIVSLFSYGI